MNLDAPIRELKGVGEKTEKLFSLMGVYTVRDILLYFPREYLEYPDPIQPSACVPGQHAAVFVHVSQPPKVNQYSKMKTAVMDIGDPSGGLLRAIWFHLPYIRSVLKKNRDCILYGRVSEKKGTLYLDQPSVFSPEQYRELQKTIQPVYHLTKGLGNQTVKKTVAQALKVFDESDSLPAEIRLRRGLCTWQEAVQNVHFPADRDACITARRRLVFDEFFAYLKQMRALKEERNESVNPFALRHAFSLEETEEKLPYSLTTAQKRSILDVMSDLNGPHLMDRLLQGDVGSGKTVVAFLAMLHMAKNGYQSVMMAPTDVLARQHAKKLTDFVKMMGAAYPVVLLTGSLKTAERRAALETIRTDPNALIVGTHALIQEAVSYEKLALVITDEQHRFGVNQRTALSEKGAKPHCLVMSATPIPRTLAIFLYGDLDISLIDEVPAMRLPIKNCVVAPSWHETAYRFIEKEVQNGHQAYVVCPLVEESEESDGENVTDYAEKLRTRFGGKYEIGILHGRMKPEEKNDVMERFLKNEIRILVATTVIEVGVDVPNATVMMIENADRFGLAQLHQLRGRVGRGDAQGYCIFVQSNDTENPRLKVLNESNDGFYIAQEDLKMRGPGDFFGIRQSGDLAFRIADIYQDMSVLREAAEEVNMLS